MIVPTVSRTGRTAKYPPSTQKNSRNAAPTAGPSPGAISASLPSRPGARLDVVVSLVLTRFAFRAVEGGLAGWRSGGLAVWRPLQPRTTAPPQDRQTASPPDRQAPGVRSRMLSCQDPTRRAGVM